MTEDLVAWLRTQLDDDESAALGAKGDTSGRWTQDDGPPEDIVLFDKSGKLTLGQARHIGRHDPARVLREIDAKRRITEVHHVVGGWQDEDGHDLGDGCEECGHSEEYSDRGGWCETLRLLALPYADRPGYREEWRP
ncbi:hypothetical protein HMPREF1486_03179 [Streptomyces sp. HPH0547]|uniref:DUF6221 family protein n=1 Tax=Streptomyces TaxID=1883 RepID=UPI00034E6EE2|nr:DUF6221 family protein [Streptomyces sp. HPH0547]EPD94626.1 hypothetical protein HMPREF1486_03179 [Streptomyces sp. HPH0547]